MNKQETIALITAALFDANNDLRRKDGLTLLSWEKTEHFSCWPSTALRKSIETHAEAVYGALHNYLED